MISYKKSVSACLIAVFGAFSTLPLNADAATIDELKDKKDKISNDIQVAEAERENKRAASQDNAAALESIQGEIANTKARIGQIEGEITTTLANIEAKTAEIAVKQQEYDERKATLDKRLVDIYKNGDASFLDVVFEAEDFSDFLTRFEYMSYVAKKDQSLLEEIRAMKESLENQKMALEVAKANLDSLRAEQVQREAGLRSQEAEKAAIAAELKKEEEALNAAIAKMNQDSAAIGAEIVEIQRLEAERAAAAAAAAAAQKRAQAQQAASASAVSAAPIIPMGDMKVATTVSASGYTWPVPASHRITSPYGPRRSPFGGYSEFHMGVDIGAPMGTPVVASKAGKIIIQVYHPSYGNYIVVDHGDSYSTVYAHLSAFASTLGAEVGAGQVIGYIGSTGASTGPHLHFEVRINGQHTNPMGYIG